ncbi:sensor histidine kinase [Corynebacterium poyangense]|nr:histidine kinase [Corynebacterium poyangense]
MWVKEVVRVGILLWFTITYLLTLNSLLTRFLILSAALLFLAFPWINSRYRDWALGLIALSITAGLCDPTYYQTIIIAPIPCYAIYLAAASSQRRIFFLIWSVVGVSFAILSGHSPIERTDWIVDLVLCGITMIILGFFYLLGVIRWRQDQRIELLEAQLATAALQERTRIARELHDIIAHNLTGVIALADGARYAAEHDSQVAVKALETISETSRESLADMRGVLHTLREDTPREISAPPGFEQIPELISEAEKQGLEIIVTGLSQERSLSSVKSFTAYRVTQELITNMLRYSNPPRGTLEFVGAENITIIASNPYLSDAHSSPGLGLQGISERITAIGGTMNIDSTQGIFRVEVELGD